MKNLLIVGFVILVFWVWAGVFDNIKPVNVEPVYIEPVNVQPVNVKPIEPCIPYLNYTLTQGFHGASYGHLAIDLSYGKGAPLYAPLSGDVVTYIDKDDNTTLEISNGDYLVTLLHGDFIVSGQVKKDQLVGYESNHGYVFDMYGRRCVTDDCGYHTHLNVFDKKLNRSVDPFLGC